MKVNLKPFTLQIKGNRVTRDKINFSEYLLQSEGILAGTRVVSITLEDLAPLHHSPRLAKSLKLATKVLSLFQPLPPPVADYQGPVIKALKPTNQKCPLVHLINMTN